MKKTKKSAIYQYKATICFVFGHMMYIFSLFMYKLYGASVTIAALQLSAIIIELMSVVLYAFYFKEKRKERKSNGK